MNALFCQEAKLGIALTRYSTTLWRPNRRIHALKAKALLSGSGMERGFGSVFRHHLPPRAARRGPRRFWRGCAVAEATRIL